MLSMDTSVKCFALGLCESIDAVTHRYEKASRCHSIPLRESDLKHVLTVIYILVIFKVIPEIII